MKRTLLFVSLFVLILAACATTQTQSPTQPAPTSAVAYPSPTQAATAQTAPTQPAAGAASPTSPSETSATAPAASSGVVTYHIVAGESQVSYEVGETLFNENNRLNLAKGITTQITGDITIDKSNVKNAKVGEIDVDVSQFKSDSNRRDNYIQHTGLQSSTYPIAKFAPTSIDGLPDSATEGQDLTFKVTGNLTVKQVTKPVTFDVTAKLSGDTLSGTATTTILMSDFGVGPLKLAILQTEDKVKLTFIFVARP